MLLKRGSASYLSRTGSVSWYLMKWESRATWVIRCSLMVLEDLRTLDPWGRPSSWQTMLSHLWWGAYLKNGNSPLVTFFGIGLHVKVLVCDQGSNNRQFLKSFSEVTVDKPYFFYSGNKVYVIYDPPHLIKNVRNTLKKLAFFMKETPSVGNT